MSEPDRGAYTPQTDASLAFDARRPVRGGAGPASSTLVISGVILVLLLAAAGFWLYRHGGRGADDAPRPVGTVVADTKAPAPAQSQPEDDAAGLQIYKQDELPASEPTFAPGPETVRPRPVPQTQAGAPAAPGATSSVVAAPVVATPKAASQVAAAPAVTAAPKPAVAGGAMVQIGAFSSSALADRGWNDAAAVAPGLAAGKGKKVEVIDKDGVTLYRTSVTGFSSRADAQAFCDRLKGAGKSCFVK